MNNICLKCNKNRHYHYINIMDNRNRQYAVYSMFMHTFGDVMVVT